MPNEELKNCRCGGKPLVRRTNKKKFNVLCPHCQRFYSRDHDTREEAVSAWNANISTKAKKN